jgi:hypothetical protein
MIYRHLTLAALLSLACFSSTCQPDASAPANNSSDTSPANSSARTTSPEARSTPGALIINPIFDVTPDQLRAAFDDYESRGESGQHVSVGEEKSLNVTANGSHGPGTLKLRVLFLSPAEQARAKGYTFGLVAKQRTPDDRKAVENSSLSIISQRLNQVYFHVFLEPAGTDDESIPVISFELLNGDGQRISPKTQPTSYSAGKDLIGSVALAEEGQELSFPLYNGTTPHLTNRMEKMSLIVHAGDTEQTLEYRLKK